MSNWNMGVYRPRPKGDYDDTTEYLKPGECHYCPLGHSHSLINNSDTEELCFLAVVPEHNA